jgi:general secretion pathway protein C
MKFDLFSLYSTKYAQWMSIAFILIFSIFIIAEWCTLIFSSVTKPSLPQTAEEVKVMAKQNSSTALLNSPLFGVYVPNNLNETSVKKSMLNVTVMGILFANKIGDSQVIIRSASGDEKTYKSGDKIPGGAVIKRIMASGILVEREGALESLSLTKSELIFEPVAKPMKGE